MPVIASVVEGHGEVLALPGLIRRLAQRRGIWHVECPTPFRQPRTSLADLDQLTKAVRFAGARVTGAGGVLVVLDADDDCPVALRSKLDAVQERSDVPVSIVVANREYEAWFLAAAESLSGVTAPAGVADPEGPRDAKGRLEHLMTEKYRETRHQPAFSNQLDLDLAERRGRSFRRLVHAVDVLLGC